MSPAHSMRPLAVRAWRSVVFVFTAVVLLGASACSDDPTEQTDDIEGTWLLESDAGIFYLDVGGEEIIVYSRQTGSSCFTFRVFAIAEIDGNTYTLVEEGLGEFETEIERDGDEIVVDGEIRYEATTHDVEDLDICSLPLTCLDLTFYPLPADIDGSLGPGDPQLGSGVYIDPVAFELAATTTVEIAMTSGDFDTYLMLLDGETGEFLADNDDSGSDTDSRIVRTLAGGCYIVSASSYGPGTGAYTLTIEEQ